jgi:hypothetical protein
MFGAVGGLVVLKRVTAARLQSRETQQLLCLFAEQPITNCTQFRQCERSGMCRLDAILENFLDLEMFGLHGSAWLQ